MQYDDKMKLEGERMGRKKNVSIFPNYVKVGDYNAEKMSRLVTLAKGNRSINDFARECGINASTISRIVNMKNKEACSDEVIEAIVENAENKLEVTVPILMSANGRAEIFSEAHEKATYQRLQKYMEILESRIDLKSDYSIICEALEKQGFKACVTTQHRTSWPITGDYTFDFEIETDAFKEKKIDRWLFDAAANTKDKWVNPVKKMEQIFSMAYLDSPIEKKIKISVIVYYKEFFEKVKEVFSGIKVKDCLSFVYIDRENRKLVDEYNISQCDREENIN